MKRLGDRKQETCDGRQTQDFKTIDKNRNSMVKKKVFNFNNITLIVAYFILSVVFILIFLQ